ncbi:MAG: nucleotidyltransferase domain-containing protein, partial [archaeon]|nr:nucleotidyltransferase domain-containing protein [archaeon]
MNDLSRIFTNNNIRILKELSKSDGLYIREIAERTSISPAKVHQAIKLFKEFELVLEKRVKNKKVISLDRDSILLKRIRSLLNIFEISGLKEFRELLDYGKVGIYGSFARGEDLPESDIDMWIYSDKKLNLAELKGITRGIEKHFGKEVKLLILSKNKINNLREKDPEFYF